MTVIEPLQAFNREMLSTIPKNVKIGAHSYKVVFTDTLDSDGKLDREKGIIYINTNLMPSEKLETFFHEVIHAMNGELDEVLTESLAQQLTHFLTENKII